jgi:hypothetical protein
VFHCNLTGCSQVAEDSGRANADYQDNMMSIDRTPIAGALVAAALVVLVPAVSGCHPPERPAERVADTPPSGTPAAAPVPAAGTPVSPGLLYGRITTVDGVTYQGRLRWGQDQEASWSDYFNGTKDGNPWAVHAPAGERPTEGSRFEIFGIPFGRSQGSDRFDRQFMARFGDIARIEAHLADVQVTLKSGTTFQLDRFEAGDMDDGVRVWDVSRGVVDLDARRIRAIEFLPTASSVAAADRLHGTVRARDGEFSGFIQWNRQEGIRSDEFDGRTADGEVRLRYDIIRSITRQSSDSAMVTLLDGRELVLSGTRDAGDGNLGVYVDDARYGRVLVSWDAFDRVDFSPAGASAAYADFPPGRALAGTVTTRDGRRLAGRLVYDFDESETTETLDAPLRGVDYTIPFARIASVVPAGRDGGGAHRATVVLRDGPRVSLEPAGDLGDGNAGMLIFADGRKDPDYVPWKDVAQVDFEAAPASVAPSSAR